MALSCAVLESKILQEVDYCTGDRKKGFVGFWRNKNVQKTQCDRDIRKKYAADIDRCEQEQSAKDAATDATVTGTEAPVSKYGMIALVVLFIVLIYFYFK